MTLETRPLAQITHEALRLLYAELGVVETVRFLNQFTTGYGNYTEDRRALVEQQSFDEALEEVMAYQAGRNNRQT